MAPALELVTAALRAVQAFRGLQPIPASWAHQLHTKGEDEQEDEETGYQQSASPISH
jgi:hypothetical protein